jgi:multidrug resistance efflux pump
VSRNRFRAAWPREKLSAWRKVFTDFAQSLEQNRPRLRAPVLVAGALLLLWAGWFFGTEVTVYELSREARLEVDAAPHHVDVPVTGRVAAVRAAMGGTVAAGETLIELDVEPLELMLAAERQRAEALYPQIAAVRRELAERVRGASFESHVAAATQNEARARKRAEEAVARLRTAESDQIEALSRAQVVPKVESTRYAAEAERVREEVAAQTMGLERLSREQRVRVSERLAALSRLEAQIGSLEAEQKLALARSRLHEQDIELRTIRAPVAGRIGAMDALRPGTVLKEGARVATVIPRGKLRVTARFDAAAAVGRVSPGQRARLRLHGFPWTKFGIVEARVDSVGNEAALGLVRVELGIPDPSRHLAIPVQHGLHGLVEVEVDHVSPASLLLDAAGRFLDRMDAPARARGRTP